MSLSSANSVTDILSIRNGPSSPSSSNGKFSGAAEAADMNHQQTVDVGTPRHPTGWSTAKVCYHNFAKLPSGKGESVDSRPFSLHGLDWYLRIHPGGAASANGDDTWVSLYLRCKSAAEQNVPVEAEFSLALLRTDGGIDSMMSCPCNAFRRKRKGWPNFTERSRVLEGRNQLLDDVGTLKVLVKVQLFKERETNFVPRNELNLARLLMEANGASSGDGERDGCGTANTSDVQFSVEGTTVHAHRLILKLAAPALAQLCEDADDGTPVPVMGVRSPIFQGVLRFVYGDVIPEDVWKIKSGATAAEAPGIESAANDEDANDATIECPTSQSMELLDAANRFGVLGLKILAETKVAELDISVSTASDLILYADSHSCPLLKVRLYSS